MWRPYAQLTTARLRQLIEQNRAERDALAGTERSGEASEYYGPAIADLEDELKRRGAKDLPPDWEQTADEKFAAQVADITPDDNE